MITILSIIASFVLTAMCGLFFVNTLKADGMITGLVMLTLNSLFAIEFYKLLCNIL